MNAEEDDYVGYYYGYCCGKVFGLKGDRVEKCEDDYYGFGHCPVCGSLSKMDQEWAE